MTTQTKPLSFHEIDDLGFAALSSRLNISNLPASYRSFSLGPLMELLHLVGAGLLPDPLAGKWLALNGAAALVNAIQGGHDYWVCTKTGRMGTLRTARSGASADDQLTAFLMHAKRAAKEVAKLPGSTPGQLAAALGEMESNIHEHSKSPSTGILAFRATKGVFEFVAADHGIGVLASLQSNSDFADLADHGQALQLALSEGVSRFGASSSRGHGFRPLFLGLMNLQGFLRFRSGNQALILDGSSVNLATAGVLQKPPVDGFFVSVQVTTATGSPASPMLPHEEGQDPRSKSTAP